MASESRSIQLEFGGIVVRVEGPDSLRAQEALLGRVLDRLSDNSGRMTMGFQSGSSLPGSELSEDR